MNHEQLQRQIEAEANYLEEKHKIERERYHQMHPDDKDAQSSPYFKEEHPVEAQQVELPVYDEKH